MHSMMRELRNKKILLGVTGSIAAYKSVDLARNLVEEKASVHLVMTDAARCFITPLTFEAVSRNRVHCTLFDDPFSHITLTADADLMVIAPITADMISKLAQGAGDDLLSTCVLSFRGKVIIAPAMNWRMYENGIVQDNLRRLLAHGIVAVGPERGSLACGEEGTGRMADIKMILETIRAVIGTKDLLERRILVTAGPTREYLDPVRFLSNRSSGKMGFAIASAASRRGAEVVLVSGPSTLEPPYGVEYIPVDTASEMREALLRNMGGCNALIMAAAVADFMPLVKEDRKIEKSDRMMCEFVKTPDILSEIGSMEKRPLLIGFAAETGHDLDSAKRKLIEKGIDMIVFNNVSSKNSGFDVDTNEITLIDRETVSPFPLMTKDEAADVILDRVVQLLLDIS
jgi:phosphopantothenoylcysteine decarboxylase / phosphopantothenate---cysteine ligase